jgi:tRNA (cytidine/uridine-2'-O-)-methyltransferase
MKVILVNPLIPQNTGSIGRLCAGMDVELVLVEPLGFSLDDRYLKRAGLDYWPWIRLTVAKNWQEAFADVKRPWFFTVHTHQSYVDVKYEENDALVFGSENHGLPMELLQAYPSSQRVAIPMVNPDVRSLNLAQCAAVGLCEAKRQVGFPPHRQANQPKSLPPSLVDE